MILMWERQGLAFEHLFTGHSSLKAVDQGEVGEVQLLVHAAHYWAQQRRSSTRI